MADEAVELADDADLDETEAWEAWGSSTPGGPSRVGSSLALAAQEAAAALARQGAREEAVLARCALEEEARRRRGGGGEEEDARLKQATAAKVSSPS